jgi:hypothetical protein
VASAGAVVTAAALALPASAGPASVASHNHATITVRQIAFGKKLHHNFRPNGTGAWKSESLAGPDDLSFLDGHLYVGFQNGVGSQGEVSPDGNLDSTVVEFTLLGKDVRQWDVKGKVDGLTADPSAGKVIATVNEDHNSSLYTISPRTGSVTHYAYNKPLPHNGGTDAISIFRGQILISASAPGTVGKPAPQPTYPAVYVVTLNPKTKVATVRALFYDEATAKAVNGPHAGKNVKLGLTDPDSSEVVPSDSPSFRGDFMLDSQGDQELIFDRITGGWRQSLSVLSLPTSVDDTAWVTRHLGVLYTTDSTADTLDAVYGNLPVGTAYTAVTPCNANSAPSTCPAPGFPANYLGTVNLKTGALPRVQTTGAAVQPKGMIFVPIGF